MVAKIGQKCYYCYLKVKNAVEVVLPLKQGLKLKTFFRYLKFFDGWSGSSIKTRIETFSGTNPAKTTWSVEVVLPLKQGLKLFSSISTAFSFSSWSGSSIKTRIETTYTVISLSGYLRCWSGSSIKTRINPLRGKLQIPNSKFQTIWCPSGILSKPPAISPAPVTWKIKTR